MLRLLLFTTLIGWLALPCHAADPTPDQVLGDMKKVADWQLTKMGADHAKNWVHGVLYTGVISLWQVSHDDKYLSDMRTIAEANKWKLGRPYHADDQTVGQTYCDIYAVDKKPEELAGIKADFDQVLTQPPANVSLERTKGQWQDRWAWSDSLFMAPPAWAKLSKVTGDPQYLTFMDKNYWDTVSYLYDTQDNLFYRDSTYFTKRDANGAKIFWGRGNAWVYAGLVRVLEAMPADYPSRGKYVQLYRQMTASLIKAQGADGLWRMSLLDPGTTEGETSSSGLILYGLAWGINHGLLDPKQFREPAMKSWSALAVRVQPDGKLGWIQPVGEAPGKLGPDTTDLFGIGAFLLAGSEIYHLVGG